MRVGVIVGMMIVTTGFYLRFPLALICDSKSRSGRLHFAGNKVHLREQPRFSAKVIEIRPSVPGYPWTSSSPQLLAVDGRSGFKRMTRLPKSS